ALEKIVPDRAAFVGFLQERWRLFLDRVAGSAPDPSASGQLHYRGPVDLPFDHSDVRVYIDTLFLEGVLRPVPHESAAALARRWWGVGVRLVPEGPPWPRLGGLLGPEGPAVPAPDAKHQEWLSFAVRWAELLALWHGASPGVRGRLEGRFGTLRQAVD